MTLHYLNKVPRAARSGRTKKKIQGEKKKASAARLLVLFGERAVWCYGGISIWLALGGRGWGLKVAAFMGCR